MLGNWIRQTTTTTGTGNLTLSTVTGYAAFTDYFAADERFAYSILDDATGLPIEAGIGYLSSGALVREIVESTLVSGTLDRSNPSAVTLAAGTKRVICAGTAGNLLSAAPVMWTGATYKSYGDPHVQQSGGGVALVANRVNITPFVKAVNADIDAVLIRVTTAGAGGIQAKAAIMAYAANGGPGAVLAESSGVAVDSTGIKTLTFTRFNPPSRFFVCVLSDGTPSIQGFSSGGVSTHALGCDSTLNGFTFLTHAGATGLTFPTSWTLVGGNGSRIQVMVRVA